MDRSDPTDERLVDGPGLRDSEYVPTPADIAVAWRLPVEQVLMVLRPDESPAFLRRLLAIKIQSAPAPRVPTAASGVDAVREADSHPFPSANVPATTEKPMPVRAQRVPASAPTGHYHGGVRAWRISEIVTNRAKLRLLDEYLQTVRDDISRVYKVTADGKHHQSRRPRALRNPFEINASDCASWAAGLVFDTRDKDHCVLVNLRDVATGAFDMEFLGTALEGVHYPDRELLHYLEFGCRLKSRFPFAAVVCPPHVSARPWMNEIVEQVREEEDNKWLFSSTVLPFIPIHAAAYGIAFKKHRYPLKWRRTTDMSYPEGLSVNDFIDLQEDFPALKLVRVQEIMEASAVLRSAWRYVVEHEPDLSAAEREALRDSMEPVAALEDLSKFFNRFVMAPSSVHLQSGYFVEPVRDTHGELVLDGNGLPVVDGSFKTSTRLQFGSKCGPSIGSRAADLFVAIYRKQMDEWEAAVEEAARPTVPGVAPSAAALGITPHALRAWLDLRASMGWAVSAESGPAGAREEKVGAESRTGDSSEDQKQRQREQSRPFWCAQYIDDVTMIQLGRARAMRSLLTFWRIVEGIGFPVADGKTAVGSSVELLGFEMYLREGVVRVTDDKHRLYLDWLDRVIASDFIEISEFKSLMGTVEFGLVTVQGARMHMTRPYRLLHSPAPFDRINGRRGRYLSPEVRSDFAAIRELFATTTGAAMIDDCITFQPSSECHVGFTDSCRELAVGSYSGMGGWDVLTGRYWFYQFSEAEKVLPIHITEQIAQIVQLRLNAEALRDSSYVEMIDNAAVVSVSRSEGARDERMAELLLVRRAILLEFNITMQTRWISSKENRQADQISRDAVDEFISEAAAAQIPLGEGLNLRDHPDLIPDLQWLIDRMITLTRKS